MIMLAGGHQSHFENHLCITQFSVAITNYQRPGINKAEKCIWHIVLEAEKYQNMAPVSAWHLVRAFLVQANMEGAT